jgi:hypothetical protein
MATNRINKRTDVDESGYAAWSRAAHQESPFVTHLAPRPTDEHLDAEESELAEAGLVRLPEKSLLDSFWRMPAPRVSFVDAVSAVTSERDED